jgi:hypothetical protein
MICLYPLEGTSKPPFQHDKTCWSVSFNPQKVKWYNPFYLLKRIIMDTFRITTTVSKDGRLSIKGLPLLPGAKVEVTVRTMAQKRQALTGELKALFKEVRKLPQAKSISEAEISAEIAEYRASKTG